MNKLDCKKPKPCKPEPATTPKPKSCSPAFNLCVGDRTLKWDGFCPTIERTRNTPDGTYTSVTVVDGCIVGYGYADVATYTPPYCNPNPARCQGQGQGATATYTVSPNSDNSLVESSSGLFARTFVQGKGNIAVSGKGTVQSPYVVSFNGNSGKTTVVGEAGITHRESGGVTYVGLSPVGITKGMYNGFSINEYGQIIGFSDAVARDGSSVKAGAGLTAVDDGSVTTIAHEEHDIGTTAVFGGYAVVLNKSGHIIDLDRIATVTPGTYALGAYNIAINEYGGIVSITQNGEVPSNGGSFTTSDGSVVRYDSTGRITGTDNTGISVVSSTTQSGAVVAMYRIMPNELGVVTDIENYGEAMDIISSNITRELKVSIPNTPVRIRSAVIHGADGHTIDLQGRTITLRTIPYKPITITLRA